MRYYKYLYLSDTLKRKKDKLIKKIEKEKIIPDLYLIRLAANEKDQLEISSYRHLLHLPCPKQDLLVVGMTKGYEDAVYLVEEIVQEVYNKTKGADIRSYILRKEQEG
mgnify:CR=1 FL=1